MASLIGGDFGPEELNQVLSTQLDALAISSEAKQHMIPALLGIAKLAKVQSQWCAFQSLSLCLTMPMSLLVYKYVRVDLASTADGVRARARARGLQCWGLLSDPPATLLFQLRERLHDLVY